MLAGYKHCSWHKQRSPACTPVLCLPPRAGTQAYVRKLEARLLSVRHAAELEQRCAQLKGQVRQLQSAWLSSSMLCCHARVLCNQVTASTMPLSAAMPLPSVTSCHSWHHSC